MFLRALWLGTAVLFVSLSGALATALGKINESDSSDLYLLLELDARAPMPALIIQTGAVEVGPEQARFARMIFAPPETKARLRAAGYVLLPAGAFAAICGFTPSSQLIPSRNA